MEAPEDELQDLEADPAASDAAAAPDAGAEPAAAEPAAPVQAPPEPAEEPEQVDGKPKYKNGDRVTFKVVGKVTKIYETAAAGTGTHSYLVTVEERKGSMEFLVPESALKVDDGKNRK